jgi:2-polyprenyl-6-methoxyphenol hydroxylase-like FAD-dependent oxidoreductase
LALPTLQNAAGREKTDIRERGQVLILNVDRESAVMFVSRARSEAGQSIRETPLSGLGDDPNVPFRIERYVTQGNAKRIFEEPRIALGEAMDSGLRPRVCGTVAHRFSRANVPRIAGQKCRHAKNISRYESPQKNLVPITRQNGEVHRTGLQQKQTSSRLVGLDDSLRRGKSEFEGGNQNSSGLLLGEARKKPDGGAVNHKGHPDCVKPNDWLQLYQHIPAHVKRAAAFTADILSTLPAGISQNFVFQSFYIHMKAALESKKSAQNHSIRDVIVSGAGPVGLFLACELALAKCSVLMLEKAENPQSPLKQLPFGIRGLSAPTIEALYRRGLLRELEVHKRLKNPHQNSEEGSRRQVGHFAGIPFREGDIDASQWKYRLPSSTDTSLISEIQELETVLARRAENLGVEIRRGLAVADFHQTADGVTVQCGDQSFQSKWLVGCDGSRSVVRKAGGFEFAGTEPEFTGYSTQVDVADPEKLSPGRNVTSKGMYLQSQPGYVVIQDFDGGAFHNSEKPMTREHVQEVLRRVSNTDVTISALHTVTTWTDRARQATTYRNGRILLAGDAAHIHSPLGGQGLNLGLGDAMNLGWKLAATVRKKAPENLLDTHQTEQHPIGVQVLDWSRA